VDFILTHQGRLDGGGQTVYNDLLFHIGGYSVLLPILTILYSKEISRYGNNLELFIFFFDLNLQFR